MVAHDFFYFKKHLIKCENVGPYVCPHMYLIYNPNESLTHEININVGKVVQERPLSQGEGSRDFFFLKKKKKNPEIYLVVFKKYFCKKQKIKKIPP